MFWLLIIVVFILYGGFRIVLGWVVSKQAAAKFDHLLWRFLMNVLKFIVVALAAFILWALVWGATGNK
jgi:energy-coupling factor transporter transmembrane protein EcfT